MRIVNSESGICNTLHMTINVFFAKALGENKRYNDIKTIGKKRWTSGDR